MSGIRNVLFVIVDQLRSDALGCCGNDFVKTPALDGLAREGVLFPACTAQAAPCGPSRACLMTGTYLHRNRSTRNEVPLARARCSWGRWLRDAGYAPALIGYHDYCPHPDELPEGDPRRTRFSYHNTLPGFDTEIYHEYTSPEYRAFLEERGHGDEEIARWEKHPWDVPPEGPGERWKKSFPAVFTAEESKPRFLTDRAADYVRRKAGEGWVLNLNILPPHSPDVCPAPYHAMYSPDRMPAPCRSEEERLRGHPYHRHMICEDDEAVHRWWREQRAVYHGMVSEVDHNLGRLFDTLETTGQWDNTLIIFTADHGAYNGDHWFSEKGHYFDSSLQVPLIIRDPSPAANGTRGSTVKDPAASVDIVPTLLALLGLDIPPRVQGRSLAGYLDGSQKTPVNEAVFSEFDYSDPFHPGPDDAKKLLWIIRDTNYKYVEFADPAYDPVFFSLREDPEELNDLAGRQDSVPLMWHYSRRLLQWRMRGEDRSVTDLMAETLGAAL